MRHGEQSDPSCQSAESRPRLAFRLRPWTRADSQYSSADSPRIQRDPAVPAISFHPLGLTQWDGSNILLDPSLHLVSRITGLAVLATIVNLFALLFFLTTTADHELAIVQAQLVVDIQFLIIIAWLLAKLLSADQKSSIAG